MQLVWAQSDAQVYLDRMSHSFRELDYRGVFTYEFGSRMEALRIVHAVRDGVEQERLTHLNGETTEYYRDGHKLSCVHPGHQMLRLEGGAGGPFARSLMAEHRATDFYQFSVGEMTRVANRPAREIVVLPNDPYRYGFRLYLDEESGLLLKSVTLGARSEILERFQFVQIEIGVPIDDEELMLIASSPGLARHHVLQVAAVEEGAGRNEIPRPGWLPPGFTRSAQGEGSRDPAASVAMYTDGFATFTLILEAVEAAQVLATDGRARKGATVAYTRHLAAEGQDYVLTVVGEIPLMTARKVARSVALDGA